MENKHLENALYARGYLISKKDLTNDVQKLTSRKWDCKKIDNTAYVIYDHRVKLALSKKANYFVCILGTAVDVNLMTEDLQTISDKLVELSSDDFWNYVDELCGRYLIVYGNESNTFIVQDATGMRSCFYGKELVSSHYELINEFEKNDYIPYWHEYKQLKDKEKPWYLPGDLTPYENIYQLIPNHQLDLNTKQVKRIYPRDNSTHLDPKYAVDYFASILKKQTEVLSKNHNFLISMTGGKDSRTSLSAFKDVSKDKILLFSYLFNTESCKKDNEIAQKISDHVKLEYKSLVLGDCEVFSVNSVGCGKKINAGVSRKQLTATVSFLNIKYC